MPREISPREYRHHGNVRWRVLVPTELRGDGPARRIYASEKEARKFCRELNIARGSWGQKLLALSDEDQGRLARALERTGSVSALELAAEAWAKGHARLVKPLLEAVTEFLATKKDKRSWQYLENLDVALGQFALGRETTAVSDITTADVSAWLDGQGWSAMTRLTYVRRLETFWSWARKQGFAASDPTRGYERPDDTSGPVVVLTVDEARRLLTTCQRLDPALLPYFAICLFAGIRPDETKRLTPEDIKNGQPLSESPNALHRAEVRLLVSDHRSGVNGWIEVQARKSKTRRRRLVEIHPTLKAWLALDGGHIGWRNWRPRWRIVRVAAVVGDYGPCQPIKWCGDIMRHSFASYAYPIKGAAWTSNECGHSERVLFERYRALVTESAAKEFWGILPAVQ